MRKWQYMWILTASFNLKSESPATPFTNTIMNNNPEYCLLKSFGAEQESPRKSQWEWRSK